MGALAEGLKKTIGVSTGSISWGSKAKSPTTFRTSIAKWLLTSIIS